MKFKLLFVTFIISCTYLPAQGKKYALLALAGETLVEEYISKKLEVRADSIAFKRTMHANDFSSKVINRAKTTDVFKFLNQLVLQANSGDDIILAFRMHGKQVIDAGKKDESDQKDEVLVAYDGLIYDDTLNYYLDILRKKVGNEGSILMLVDACHAGTMDKGFEDEFNAPTMLESTDYKNLSCFFSTISSESVLQSKDDLITTFCRAYDEVDQYTTFQGLFDKIQFALKKNAYGNPYAEGELNRYIRSKKTAKIPFHFSVTSKKNGEKEIYYMNGTQFDGLKVGTKMRVYPTDTPDWETSKVYTSTVVTSIGLDESTIQLPLFDSISVRGAWVVPFDDTLKLYDPIQVKFEGWKEEEKIATMQQLNLLYQVVENETSPDLILSYDTKKSLILLKEPENNPEFEFSWKSDASVQDSIFKYVTRFIRAKYLIKLEVKGTSRIVLYIDGNYPDKQIFKADQKVKLSFSGVKSKIALIEISPRYEIKFLQFVEPGSFYPDWQLTPPAGQWVIKAISGPNISDIALNFVQGGRGAKEEWEAKGKKEIQIQTFRYYITK